MPVICWKMKNTQTTINARFTPGVQSSLDLLVLGLRLDLLDLVGGAAHLFLGDLDTELAQGHDRVLEPTLLNQPARRLGHPRSEGDGR